ncbi:ATP-dependent exonuclease [Tetragenococcus osmophilus]|uniref:ATP-dependent exonuclease n=2 Tax=Tetragenococcus osmophilus TaxID=526944 RepID=A0ABM7AAF3_9ENTE|nr:DUF2075 domain-containing protein [Tetragenococcus osmophilus]AYW48400.1 ATP-dependent exonuclease [Tetragenococcus osmophilus]
MESLPSPVVYEVGYSDHSFEEISDTLPKEKAKYILNYPTVYLINDTTKQGKFSIYIGESTDIKRRTDEHLHGDIQKNNNWKNFASSETSKMFVIGHSHFNKSLTLDIENKLMQYMTSVDAVRYIFNRRLNQQNEYYTSDELDDIFSKIWQKLHRKNKTLFPAESIIRDSALFKASPFNKLKEEQLEAKDKILMKIEEALNRDKMGQLILVEGEAGTGKTVLMSSLFYELKQISGEEESNVLLNQISCHLLVNHKEQLKVYQQIAKKLGLIEKKKQSDIVSNPTSFINNHDPEEKVDVVIVDEAHLLWTQGKQSYQGKNQLEDILARARVVVAVFDRNQILSREQYWEEKQLLQMVHEANLKDNYIELQNQLRINANQQTINWIREIIDKQEVQNIPKDNNYDLKVFNTVEKMYEAIKEKAKNEDYGISRILATFDWEYNDNNRPKDEDYWSVKIGNWSLPWNLQLKPYNPREIKSKDLSWAEQAQTINEVGSTFTIQGFDLNYAAVIIGPSVQYRNGQIVFDKSASKNNKAVYRRKVNNEMRDVSKSLLNNELNVLLTRGVNGLYIYAVDPELQEALIKAQKGEL